MLRLYKAHRGDYYCKNIPYRIFKSGSFWKVQILRKEDNYIIYCADTLKEAIDYTESIILKGLKNE